MSHAFSSLDELGDGPGFRKIRQPLGVTAFGVNALVLPPHHELYFVHKGRVRVEVDGESKELGEGGLFHAEAAAQRSISNPSDEEAVVFIVGGKDGYVERDGHLVDAADLERRKSDH
jgi:mannose-6-phosphate isomerase-like protein (cupin superfamily)